MPAINVRELKHQCQRLGARQTCHYLGEALEQRHLSWRDLSIRDLFEGLVEDGTERLRALANHKTGGMAILEAADAASMGDFANITGQFLFNRIKEEYENPEFLWPELCETIPTQFLDGERIPGIGGLGDGAEVVLEGQEFPTLSPNEEYVDTPQTQKLGFIVPVTREIIVGDRTGVLLQRCGNGGHWLGIRKEKIVVDTAIGNTNTYKRNGVATNTYLSSGAYVNQQPNNLVDWRSIETQELLFDAMVDPNTGEPIILPPDTIVVPSALKKTAFRILEATGIAQVDNQPNASTIRAFSPNPKPFYKGADYKVLSSPYVKTRSSSTSRWWLGRPKKAFAFMSAWEIEGLQAPSNSEAEFVRDIMMRYKVSYRGVPAVLEPRNMSQAN